MIFVSMQKDNNVTLKDGGANTDWQDEVLRTGISHNHNVLLVVAMVLLNYIVSANIEKA